MEAVIVAMIGLVGSVIIVLVEKGRKENSRDHGFVAEKLSSLAGNMQDVKIDVLDLKSDIKELDADILNLEKNLSDHMSKESRK